MKVGDKVKAISEYAKRAGWSDKVGVISEDIKEKGYDWRVQFGHEDKDSDYFHERELVVVEED